jgi:hypothetical protein
MPSERQHRALVLEHCWSLYQILTDTFVVPDTFHTEFPVIAETALLTGALHIVLPLSLALTLSLREEYAFERHELQVRRYSYNVIDQTGSNLLRADNLPHHRTDYRGRSLSHPPHHMHDERGRVLSFSGQTPDFLHATRSLLASHFS